MKNDKRLDDLLLVACDLMLGANYYGYDTDKIFEEVMEKHGVVSGNLIKEYLIENANEFLKGMAE